jgi:hypothetical protein
MKKAQLTMEFILLLSGLLLAILVIISLFWSNPLYTTYSKPSINAREYAESLALEINNLFLAGDGTKAELLFHPTLIDNSEYVINIYSQNHLVEIKWYSAGELKQYSSQLITSSIKGNLTNLYGNINLTNIKGEIIIDN